MNKKVNPLKDNSGSSLVIVIVCLAFVGIICSILLTATVTNIQMKSVEIKAKGNFYDTESALDEIKSGLEEVVAEQLNTAYTTVMTNYIANSETQRNQMFAKTFIEGLKNFLGNSTNSSYYQISIIKSYIKNIPAEIETTESENQLVIDQTDILEPMYITLKNMKVSYTDSENYNTTITTDITLKTPSLSFEGTKEKESAFTKYSLIADKKISMNTASNVLISGSLYAGEGGINIGNASTLTIGGATDIVTRGDISVSERSTLNVVDNPNLWAKNLATLKGSDTSNATEIHINGDLYIADDLMLNAQNSKVSINGAYYGYSYGTYQGANGSELNSAINSSAIIINGTNASLDLSGVDNLLLAGRAYLDPNSRNNESQSVQGKVPTGESLAIKGNQYAYLVPAENMWCSSNPVTLEQYNAKAAGTAEVDYSKTTAPINLSNYADGYSKIFYKNSSQNLIYYYIKFKSDEKANEYMQTYYSVNNPGTSIGIVDNRIKGFAESIKINTTSTSILSTGNIFTYNTKSSLIKNTINPDANTSGTVTENQKLTALKDIATNLVSRYDAMQKSLSETLDRAAYDSTSLFRSIIDKEKLTSDANTNQSGFANGKKIISQDGKYVIYLINNETGAEFEIPTDTNYPGNGREGIVIATGSVRVSKDFKGLIIAGDTIDIDPGVKVYASEQIVEDILKANNSNVNRYFRDYASETQADEGNSEGNINISDLVVFDNWTKN